MFCVYCGQQVEDGSAFCPNCGKKLPSAADAPTPAPVEGLAPALSGQSEPLPILKLKVEMDKGSHAHAASDVVFKDAAGNVSFAARRDSLLHENYTVYQGQSVLGHMTHKSHLGGYSFDVQGKDQQLVGVLRAKYGSRGHLPPIWFERNENRIAEVQWDDGIFRYALRSPGGSQTIAEVTIGLPGGIRQNVMAWASKKYDVDVFTEDLPILVVIAFCVAVAVMSIPIR